MNVIKIMHGNNFTSKMTLLFIIFVILSITSTESQENQINVGQKTTISALKFTGKFHITYKAIFPQILINFNQMFLNKLFHYFQIISFAHFMTQPTITSCLYPEVALTTAMKILISILP